MLFFPAIFMAAVGVTPEKFYHYKNKPPSSVTKTDPKNHILDNYLISSKKNYWS